MEERKEGVKDEERGRPRTTHTSLNTLSFVGGVFTCVYLCLRMIIHLVVAGAYYSLPKFQ